MNTFYFWLLTLGHFLVDFYGNFLPALLPVMVKRFDISLTMAGVVITAASLAANLLQPLWGYSFDRRSSRLWLPIAMVASGVFMCLAGLMPNYLLLLLFPVLSGLGIGMYHPAASSYAYRLAERNRGFMVSIFASMGSLGFALAPMVAGYFLHFGGAVALLWLMIPGMLLAIPLAGIDFNRLAPRSSDEGPEVSKQRLIVSTTFVLLAVIMTLRAWGHMAIANYLPFLLESRGYSYTLAEVLLTVFLVVGAVGGIGSAWLSDRIGRKWVIFFTLLAATISGGLFMCTQGSWSLALLTVCGLTVQMAQPVMVVWSQDLMPGNIALASGVSMGLVWGLGALGVALNGWVGDILGLNWSFWLAVLVLFLASILTLAAHSPRYSPDGMR